MSIVFIMYKVQFNIVNFFGKQLKKNGSIEKIIAIEIVMFN